MEILEQIKKSQRITHDALDDILMTDIEAIELYAKGMEDFEEKGSAYMASFEKLRDAMALSGTYCAQRTDNAGDNDKNT